MPTTLPERIAPPAPRPIGALAIVAVVLAVIVLACGTLMVPADRRRRGEPGGPRRLTALFPRRKRR